MCEREIKCVELRAVVEVDNFLQLYNRAARSCQETTTTTRAAQAFLPEMVFHCWQSGASWESVVGHANYGGYWKIPANHLC